jgi:serine/threonine protein kinase
VCLLYLLLLVLERHGINHHDLSPDNFLFLTEDNLVVFDLALSSRIPINPLTRQRTLIAPDNNLFGTMAWMDPFVYDHANPYDGVAMDLWAAALILYNMLTNEYCYERPNRFENVCYNYFIHLQGLWSRNEAAVDLLHEYGGRAIAGDPNARSLCIRIHQLSVANLNISPQAMNLLENLLNEDPAQRFTLAQAMESDYVTAFRD